MTIATLTAEQVAALDVIRDRWIDIGWSTERGLMTLRMALFLFVAVPVFFAAVCHVVAVVLDLVEAAWFAAHPNPKTQRSPLREKEFHHES